MGIASDQLLHGTGVDQNSLYETSTRVSLKQTLKLADNVLRLTKDPAFGLKLGAEVKTNDGGIATIAAQSAGNHFWTKTRLLERYHKLFGQILLPSWTTFNDHQVYRLTTPTELGAALPFFIEEAFTSVYTTINRIYKIDIKPIVIRLAYDKPDYSEHYNDVFSCPIEFNATHNEFVFNFLSLSPSENPEHPLNLALYQQMCETLDQRAGIVDRVRALLIQKGYNTTMEDVASILGMTTRTLARHLEQSTKSFQALKDEVRLDRAQQLLRHTSLPIEKIADAIGFRSTKRFRDFFARQLGKTPSDYRINT